MTHEDAVAMIEVLKQIVSCLGIIAAACGGSLTGGFAYLLMLRVKK